MNIAGIHKNSFVDYPGKIASVVFTPGCNMDCFYCHNRHILSQNAASVWDTDKFLEFISQRKKLLDAVVISGGEPTLQKDLEQFISSIKDMGYAVKLDTNGSNPEYLHYLLTADLLDYVAMDVKAPFERYSEICGIDVDTDKIKRSIRMIMESDIAYEFRTTFVSCLQQSDIFKIIEYIQGADLYALQQFKNPLGSKILCKPHSGDYIRRTCDKAKRYVKQCIVRGV
ncbi:MAG: anaerobic ribonucleoside-triphosphate reductase activating protein [Clostridia bacterium]|nr:anaerobic ribonucleoside-triphosphate reductase activating protein [Clostridia bacterium]